MKIKLVTAKNIKKLRLIKGFTVIQLAKQLNVSRQTIYMYEAGESLPKVTILPKLAEVLECSVEDIFKD